MCINCAHMNICLFLDFGSLDWLDIAYDDSPKCFSSYGAGYSSCINAVHHTTFAYMHMHIAYDGSLKSFSIKSCFSLFTDLQNAMTVSFTTLQDIAKFVKFRKVFSLSGSHFSLVLHRSLFASYVFMFQFWFVVSSSDVEPGGFHRYSSLRQ